MVEDQCSIQVDQPEVKISRLRTENSEEDIDCYFVLNKSDLKCNKKFNEDYFNKVYKI